MTQRDATPQEMSDSEPVIEDASLPTMDEMMTTEMRSEDEATAGAVEFMTEPAPIEVTAEGDMYPDMEAADDPPHDTAGAAAFEASDGGQGYVRLAVHVRDGAMEIVDASVVDGPLVTNSDLTGQMVYQATVGGRRVAAEAFTELGEAIGFAPPDEPELGHHVAEIGEFEFNVRVPREDLSLNELPTLEIELLRPTRTTQLSEELDVPPGVPFERAAADAGVEMPEVVASLSGLELDSLPSAAQQSLRAKLR